MKNLFSSTRLAFALAALNLERFTGIPAPATTAPKLAHTLDGLPDKVLTRAGKTRSGIVAEVRISRSQYAHELKRYSNLNRFSRRDIARQKVFCAPGARTA